MRCSGSAIAWTPRSAGVSSWPRCWRVAPGCWPRQRRQCRSGPAPDRGARRSLSRRPAAVLGHRAARGDVELHRDRQRLRHRRRCSPGRCARTAAAATSWSLLSTSGTSPNVVAAVRARARRRHHDLGDDRTRAEPTGRARRRRAQRGRAVRPRRCRSCTWSPSIWSARRSTGRWRAPMATAGPTAKGVA